MDAARLPEVFDFDGLVVRCFPAARASEFQRLPQSERRTIPAIVRRLFSAAAKYAENNCFVCEAAATPEGRVMIAVKKDGCDELGVVCADCARLGGLDAR